MTHPQGRLAGNGPRAALVVVALLGVALVGISFVDPRPAAPPPVRLAAVIGPPTVRTVAPGPSSLPGQAGPAVLPASPPALLSIPAIGVSSPVRRVGQAADGTVAVPPPGPTYDEAAWYRYSPTPGSRGPAVIVGHVDSAKQGPSVFFHLGELRPGDRIDVTRDDGTVAHFAVQDVRRYRKSAFPTAAVYGNTTGAALRLITCGGPFDRSDGHYRDNVVVTAAMLPVEPPTRAVTAR